MRRAELLLSRFKGTNSQQTSERNSLRDQAPYETTESCMIGPSCLFQAVRTLPEACEIAANLLVFFLLSSVL